MIRRGSLFLAIILTLQTGMSGALAVNHKPTLAQIEAAKKAELAKKKVADAAMQRLLKVLHAAQSVVTADIASEAQKQGLTGPAVGEKIHQARVHAIELLKA